MNIVVTEAGDDDGAEWDAFVQTAALDNHAHCWAWRSIINASFGHQPFYLIARDSKTSDVGGILPLFLVKSVLFGKALISVPYLNGGGVVATSPDAAGALIDYADKLAEQHSVAYVELRHRQQLDQTERTLAERSHKVAMKLTLDTDAERLFSAFPAKLRSQIRRPAKSGIVAQTTAGDGDIRPALRAFYTVFAHNMRDLGTPVYPRQLFRRTVEAFGSKSQIVTVWHDQRPVAAAILVEHNGVVEIPWASSLRSYNRHSPNMMLYWEAIKQACERGAKQFDFGRSSPDAGTYRFKAQWGAQPLPLHWYYIDRRGELPDVNPDNPKYTTLVRSWQLLPLPVANTLGPWLTRSLP